MIKSKNGYGGTYTNKIEDFLGIFRIDLHEDGNFVVDAGKAFNFKTGKQHLYSDSLKELKKGLIKFIKTTEIKPFTAGYDPSEHVAVGQSTITPFFEKVTISKIKVRKTKYNNTYLQFIDSTGNAYNYAYVWTKGFCGQDMGEIKSFLIVGYKERG